MVIRHFRSGTAFAFLSFMSAAVPSLAAPHFNHIIFIIQENRTPDNLFGSNPNFEPGVDIASTGVTSTGQRVALQPVPLASCYDIGHSHRAWVAAYTQGFDKIRTHGAGCHLPRHPQFAYADNSGGTVQPYFDIASYFGFANRMFQTNQGPSYPAHQFLFGGTSAPEEDTPLFVSENTGASSTSSGRAGCTSSDTTVVKVIDQFGDETSQPPVYPCFERPTLSDLLEQGGYSWRYYAPSVSSIWTAPNSIRHICEPAYQGRTKYCAGSDWAAHVVPDNPAQVLTDIGNCQLANVSWVIPTAQESDHAKITDGSGPQWVASILEAVGRQSCGNESYWNDTAIFITWDDWGGWYDHVAPPAVVAPPNWGAGYVYGFRVPLLVVSAYTPPQTVVNDTLDFGSLLLFAEQNFGLGFIGPGYDTYTNYADFWAQYEGSMEGFFPARAPLRYPGLHTRWTARHFIDEPRSDLPPDDE